MPTTFEDRLLVELIDAANSPATTATTRSPLARKVLPIAAATALLGAGALTLAGTDGGSLAATKNPAITLVPHATINLSDANAVLAATTAAMDKSAYAHVVMQRTAVGEAASTMEMWVEPDGYVRRMKYSEGGVAKSDTQFPPQADQQTGTIRMVDYAAKTYQLQAPSAYRVLTLTDFRTQLDEGSYATVGQEELNGRAVTHLRETRSSVKGDVWVDSETFLPIKSTFSSDVETDVSEWGWVSTADAKNSDFEPPIPTGFTEK